MDALIYNTWFDAVEKKGMHAKYERTASWTVAGNH